MPRKSYPHTCQLRQCGKKFTSNSPKSKFCSEGCKQRNHRIEHGSAPDRHQGNANGARTKADQTITLICAYCEEEFTRDGNAAGNSVYCSDAHKAAAYRERQGYLLSFKMELELKIMYRNAQNGRNSWVTPRTATALIDRELIIRDTALFKTGYKLTEKGMEVAKRIADEHERQLLEGKGTRVQ